MHARARGRGAGAAILDRFVAAEAANVAGNPLGTLFVLAAPSTPRVDAVAEFLYDRHAAATLLGLADDISVRVESLVGRFDPNLRSHFTYHRRADGVGLRTEAGPPDQRDWPALLQLQLDTDGAVRLISGRGTDLVDAGPQESLAVSGAATIGLIRSVLAVGGALADHSGYNGSWTVGAAITGLQGAIDGSRAEGMRARYAPSYPEPEYRRATTATTAELVETPGLVTGRLLLPLLRVLEVVELHQPILTDTDEATRRPMAGR